MVKFWFKSARKRYKFITKEKMYAFYEQVSNQIDSGQIDKGVWTKAYADSGGDTEKQKVIYIELMVERIALAEEALLEHKGDKPDAKRKQMRKARVNRGWNVPGALDEKSEVRSILSFIIIIMMIGLALVGAYKLIVIAISY